MAEDNFLNVEEHSKARMTADFRLIANIRLMYKIFACMLTATFMIDKTLAKGCPTWIMTFPKLFFFFFFFSIGILVLLVGSSATKWRFGAFNLDFAEIVCWPNGGCQRRRP